MMKNTLKVFIWLCMSLSLGLLACEDNAGSQRPVVTVDQGGEDALGNVPMGATEAPKASRELRIEGAAQRSIFLRDMVALQVRLVSFDPTTRSESFVPNQTVTFKLFDTMGTEHPTGLQGTRVSRNSTNTNAQGVASINLLAGDQEVQVRIEASTADADPVYFNVAVVRPGTGGLKVKVNYDLQSGRYNYQQLIAAKASLYVNKTCEQLYVEAANLTSAYFAWDPITPYSDLNNTFVSDNFAHDAAYTVVGTLHSPSNQAVAFGCVEDVTIEGGRELTIEVDAEDLPLNYKGKFITTSRFDMTDMLRTSNDETLNTVADVIELLGTLGSDDDGRGGRLVQLFCSLTNTEGDTCNTISSVVNILGNQFVDSVLASVIPPEVMQVLEVISDVVGIVNQTTIIGEMEFTQDYPDPMTNLLETNENRWQKLRYLWRDNCMALDTADCEREFSFGNLLQNTRPITGEFTAEAEGSRLNIFEHGMTFRYGLIILGLAEQWIFPEIVGTMNGAPAPLRELLSVLMTDVCTSLDTQLNNPGFCDSVLVNALSAVIIDQLSRIDFDPDQFKIRGHATIVDQDTDLNIDQLVDGFWRGSIELENDTIYFNGCFVACKGADLNEECPEDMRECIIPMVTDMDEEEDMGGMMAPEGGMMMSDN